MSTCTKIMRAGLAVGLLGTVGCGFTEYNPGHCANNEGDATCEGLGDGSKPYCRRGTDECITPGSDHGCVAARPDDACYSPCGGRSTIDENGECVMAEESSSSSGSGTTDETTASSSGSSTSETTTQPMPCAGPEDCPDPDAPFCDGSGVCLPCDQAPLPAQADAACAALDPQRPVCDEGSCVQCTPQNLVACTETSPICDVPTQTCVPCTAHPQCGEAACNLFTGACLPADAVVHVGPGQQFTTLGEAVDSVEGGEEGTIVVHVGPDYNEAVTVSGARTIAFLAADLGPGVEPPRWVRTSGANPQLTVNVGTTVLMDGLQLSSNASSIVRALLVNSGRAWVDRSRIVQNSGGGILAANGGELVLRNCFVGGSVNNVAALEVSGATATLTYVTVGAGFGTAAALMCDAEATVDARSSLFVSEDAGGAEVQCMAATIEHSAAELDLGGTNIPLGDMATAWFLGYGTGDFHLAPAHPVAIDTAAQWQLGDPFTDIDGDPRPTTDASPDFAGADIPL